jgi:hypothetical protein
LRILTLQHLQGIWKEAVLLQVVHYFSACLDVLRKTKKNLGAASARPATASSYNVQEENPYDTSCQYVSAPFAF